MENKDVKKKVKEDLEETVIFFNEVSSESSHQIKSSTVKNSYINPNTVTHFLSITEKKVNKIEKLLTSKLNKLSSKERKSLGYSMIAVGVILSLLLMVSTFNKLDFSDVLVSPSSKEALTGLVSKATKVTSQISNLSNPTDSTAATPKLSDDEILNNWQPITSLLASTDKRRKAVAKQLGVHQGEWILATFSVDCGDCDRAASKLNQLKLNGKVSNVLAITTANQTDASVWKERLGLSFEVRSVSFDIFDDTGAVFLPTIIKLKNGVSIGAKENLEGK